MLFSLAKKTTLIVEDFAEFARSVRAMLHTNGATNVDIVYNAEDAIEACKAKKYDLILSDYNLGIKKDGQQLLEELHKYKLIKSNCVFLMLTAENTSAMVMGAVEYQPDGYIAKPFNGNLLSARLQKAIDRKDTLHPILRSVSNKNWQQALDAIQLIQKENPKYKMACLRLKYRSLKALRQYDKALTLVTEIVTQRSIPWAVEAVGEIFYLQNKFDKALEIFRNMVKEFPMALEGYDWLAKVQQQLGQPIDAQTTLSRAVEKSPKALARQKRLGALAEQNNDIKAMTTAYRNAVKFGTNSSFASPDEYLKLTGAIAKQIGQQDETIPDKLISEAEAIFAKLDKSFATTGSTQLRSNVAHASFYDACKNQDKAKLYLQRTQEIFDHLEEQLPANISLELSASLEQLGNNDIAQDILNEAIQQNLDDPIFLEKALKISGNKELIQSSRKANQFNTKAIAYFKNKKYSSAIESFSDAQALAPKNINIRLNYVQALLKLAQNLVDSSGLIETAEEMLTGVVQLSFADPRYPRYTELSRLTQLMMQKHQ